jgi:thiol-disulfide isomerase/thioredoxin
VPARGWLGRIGAAIIAPRRALASAGQREHAGRSGSDLLAAIALLLVATQLRAIVEAGWLGVAVDLGLGARAFLRVLQPLGVPLAVLVVAALVIFAAAGRRRELGRAFDLACVAVLPIVFVVLVAVVLGLAFDVAIPELAVSVVAYGWTAALVAVAIASRDSLPASSTAAVVRHARLAGRAVAVLAGAGITLQALWLAHHLEAVEPITAGEPAPALALPSIGPGGALGPRITLTPGQITVLDFWATWCNPCLRALPRLDAFARRHPDVRVIAIALDEPADARALFDELHYSPILLADDHDTSERYGVVTIPHTVVIDAQGKVRRVSRGAEMDLEAELERVR